MVRTPQSDACAPTLRVHARHPLRAALILALLAVALVAGWLRERRDRPGHRRHRQGGHPARARERRAASRPSTGSSTARRPRTAPPRRTGRRRRHRHQQNVSERVTGLDPGHALPLPRVRLERRRVRMRRRPDLPHRLARPAAGLPGHVAITGLSQPTAVRFSPDGRVFVAEKSGLIKVFDGLGDTTATTFADLRTKVHNFWDRGLLGLALDPEFPAKPFVYVLYTYDAAIGGTAPSWGTADQTGDGCPTPPGPTTDGCVVSGRLSRLEADRQPGRAPEQVLIEDWCQQFPSHSVGDLEFGADGALYATGGDGASFNYVDYGQFGNPKNPCGDPPAGPTATAADRPGRRAALPGRPRQRRTRPGCREPSSGSTQTRARRCQTTRRRRAATSTRAGSSPTACATPSASRSGPAPASPGSGTSAGTTGRRSTASRSRPDGSRTSVGPATRGPASSPATTRATSACARASTPAPP